MCIDVIKAANTELFFYGGNKEYLITQQDIFVASLSLDARYCVICYLPVSLHQRTDVILMYSNKTSVGSKGDNESG